MKKIFILLFSAALLLSFVSCASKDAPETQSPAAPEESAETLENADSENGADANADNQSEENDADAQAKAQAAEEARLAALEQKRQQALEAFENAKTARALIEENGWQGNDQNSYDSGCSKLAQAQAAYENAADGNVDESVCDIALAANEDLQKVLYASYRKLAKEERVLAVKAKNDADSVKAGVSRKEQYQAAVELFKQGDSHFATKNPKASYECYKDSKEQLSEIYADVSEKRAEAQAALEAAKKAVEESQSFAVQADEVAPITEEVAGIEAEDAVLLEDDNYADPFDAIVQIDESLEGEDAEADEVEADVAQADVDEADVEADVAETDVEADAAQADADVDVDEVETVEAE